MMAHQAIFHARQVCSYVQPHGEAGRALDAMYKAAPPAPCPVTKGQWHAYLAGPLIPQQPYCQQCSVSYCIPFSPLPGRPICRTGPDPPPPHGQAAWLAAPEVLMLLTAPSTSA